MSYEIGIDFDGTCVYHEYPNVGGDVPGAVSVLRALREQGHKLILFTMRPYGPKLNDAIVWFKNREIDLHGIQTNPNQFKWTSSPKAYAQIYIDDSALGCPLIYDATGVNLPYVDWQGVVKWLEKHKDIKL